MDLSAPALTTFQRRVKRVFDLVLSILLIPFLLPVIGICALAIWIDDPGPVFLHQIRVGEKGRLFKIIKMRSMVVDAEELRHEVEKVNECGELIHKVPNDPRITRVGRFLRRSSLDELPQIFNVLKGDMSLVGPRPELPYLVAKYGPGQYVRLSVPQGMTGLWQVNDHGDVPMYLDSEDDIYYVKNYSFWLDIQIIIKTIYVLIKGRGAF